MNTHRSYLVDLRRRNKNFTPTGQPENSRAQTKNVNRAIMAPPQNQNQQFKQNFSQTRQNQNAPQAAQNDVSMHSRQSAQSMSVSYSNHFHYVSNEEPNQGEKFEFDSEISDELNFHLTLDEKDQG